MLISEFCFKRSDHFACGASLVIHIHCSLGSLSSAVLQNLSISVNGVV